MSVETDLTALLRDHVCRYFGPASSDDASNCECGWWGENYPAHVASVVSAAYTLTPREAGASNGLICTNGPLKGQTISREETW